MIKKVQESVAAMVAESAGIEAGGVVTIDDGLSIADAGGQGGLDIAAAAAYLASLIKANERASLILEDGEEVEDLLLTTSHHYFVARKLPQQPFFLFAMTRRDEWLGKTRLLVERYSEQITKYEDILKDLL